MGERTERAKLTIKVAVAPEAAAAQRKGTAKGPLGSSDNPSNAIFTVANVITFCRLILTLVFLYLFIQNDPATRGIAVACYITAAVTDFLDGQVARRTQTVSWLGKVMDPIMDVLLLFIGAAGLMILGELPIWVGVYVVGRDIVLAAGAMWLRMYTSRPLDVIYIGKVGAACLMGGFADMLLNAPVVPGLDLIRAGWLPGFNGEPVALGIYFVYAGVIFSFVTAVIYYHTGLAIRKEKRSVRVRMNRQTHASARP